MRTGSATLPLPNRRDNVGELSDGEQQEIVIELTENPAALDEDEWQEKYDQLDADHQAEVDDSISDYADDAVGESGWERD